MCPVLTSVFGIIRSNEAQTAPRLWENNVDNEAQTAPRLWENQGVMRRRVLSRLWEKVRNVAQSALPSLGESGLTLQNSPALSPQNVDNSVSFSPF